MKTTISTAKALFFTLIILLIGQASATAQDVENEVQTRVSAEVSFEPVKKLKLSIAPEIRLYNDFSADKYLFEGEATYKLVKFLSVGAAYRIEANLRDEKDTEYLNRFSLSATVKKEFDRFEPSIRIRYTNDSDDENTNEKFLRYKASVSYNISKSKITPSVGIEAFQQLDGDGLYKMRYMVGADYKLFKNNYLGVDYKLDYFKTDYLNRHIFSLGYKVKF
ncbi:DUF2490 domain-containing protein [Mangrovibacterium sp.]|uniref:DUF2490 domain-containing protein n=1 Tax=Mangrovibacterium sp. TaxID=1961364 RepID=UPI003568E1EF